MSKLKFFYGTMGSGKTLRLLQTAFNYEENGFSVCIIKPATDTKNGKKLETRLGLERPVNILATKTTDLFNAIKKDFKDVNCVLVDEAQFLTTNQVDQLMRIATLLDIPVNAYGLRTNFYQTGIGFAGATRLLQIAQELIPLEALCRCGNVATISCRFKNGKLLTSGPAVVIDDGTSDITYAPLCQTCLQKAKSMLK